MMKKLLVLAVLGVSALCAADGAKLFGAKCAECHGGDGKEASISGKAIAGDTTALSKLTGYKSGTFGGEQKATMQASLEGLSDDDLKAIAAHIGTLK
ncbi:MAG TPA: cytochrome C [Sulfuricurvum kujiense]|uniref:Cytochrome C n=1 Tax=Sulfuricurvum kujiense TaxID=148813 RepID=A0A2D3WLL9_9BACT|nr:MULTISPECIES: c-type cytochrome [Sulfuricurvum]DAB37999.1 MAG TPA: cytochrome C [Sulfuricurvum kujiense]